MTKKVIQAAVDARDRLLRGEPLQSLVDGRAGSEIEEIDWRPDPSGFGPQSPKDVFLEHQRGASGHHNLSIILRMVRTNMVRTNHGPPSHPFDAQAFVVQHVVHA